jgi:hypothetical protein
MYAVVSHWPSASVMPNSASIAPSIELVAVWQNAPTAHAKTTTANNK